eukprot:scpid57407/ scgid26896/ 
MLLLSKAGSVCSVCCRLIVVQRCFVHSAWIASTAGCIRSRSSVLCVPNYARVVNRLLQDHSDNSISPGCYSLTKASAVGLPPIPGRCNVSKTSSADFLIQFVQRCIP